MILTSCQSLSSIVPNVAFGGGGGSPEPGKLAKSAHQEKLLESRIRVFQYYDCHRKRRGTGCTMHLVAMGARMNPWRAM